MNWDRVRGENLVSSRGSESIFEENWGSPSTESPRKKRKKKRNKAKNLIVVADSTSAKRKGGAKPKAKSHSPGKRRIGFAKARGERLEELRRHYADATSKGQQDRARALKSQIHNEERKQQRPSKEKSTKNRGRSTARAKAKQKPQAVAWAIPVERLDANSGEMRRTHAVDLKRRAFAVCGTKLDFAVRLFPQQPPGSLCEECKRSSVSGAPRASANARKSRRRITSNK